nr:LytR C-terminal domain-containing protein [Propionibacterium sp.]
MSQRTLWLAVRTPLTMLLLLAFVIGVGSWAWRQTITPIPKRPPDPCVVQKVGPEFTAKNATLRILNGTTRSGLAKNTKLVFGGAGFYVLKVGNAEPTEKTYIAGVAADSPEVVLVRSYFPADTPFVADAEQYRDHAVDIVLGADFTVDKLSKTPKTSVPLPDGTACLPPYQAIAD